MTIAPADAATWRTHPYWSKGYLYVLAPTVLARATVSQASVSYPLAEVTISFTAGSAANVPVGATVLFGTAPGKWDLGRQRVRKAPTSSTVYIGWSSQGSQLGEVLVANGAYVTFLDLREPWGKHPAPQGDALYKDYDIAPGTYPTYRSPVANAGDPVCDFGSGGYLTVSFDASDSYDFVGAGLTYLWDFKDGQIITGSTGSAQATVRFPTGARYVRLTVSDAYHSHFHDVPVIVMARSGNHAPTPVELRSRTITPRGQRINARVLADLPETTYPEGTLCILVEEEHFGSTTDALNGPTGRANVQFVGWLSEVNTDSAGSAAGPRHNTELVIMDLAARLAEIPGFTQTVRHSSSASSWREIVSPYLHDLLYYLVLHHTNAAEIASLSIPDLSAWPFAALDTGEANAYAQIGDTAMTVSHELTCDVRGGLHIVPNPLLTPRTRRSTGTALTLTQADYKRIRFEKRFLPTVYWVDASGVPATHNIGDVSQGYFAKAPGYAPGYSGQRSTLRRQLLASPYQSDLNERAALFYARLNNPYPRLEIELTHPGNLFEPALREWVLVNLTDAVAAERGYTFAQMKGLIDEIRVSYNHETGAKMTTLVVEPEPIQEAAAQTVNVTPEGSGIEIEYGGAGLPQFTVPSVDFYIPPVDFDDTDWPANETESIWPDVRDDPNRWPVEFAVLMSNGKVYRALEVEQGAGFNWEEASTGLSGSLYVDAAVQYRGELLYDHALGVHWCWTKDGLFICEDLWGATPTWELHNSQLSFANMGNSVGEKIEISVMNDPGHMVGFGWVDQDRSRAFVSEDGGETRTYLYNTISNDWYRILDIAISQAPADNGDKVVYALCQAPSRHLWVRKSTDGGYTWTTVRDIFYTPTDNFTGGSIICPYFNPDGNLNTNGDYCWISAYSQQNGIVHWTANGGAGWTVDDAFYATGDANEWGLHGPWSHVGWMHTSGWSIDMAMLTRQDGYTGTYRKRTGDTYWGWMLDGVNLLGRCGVVGFLQNGYFFAQWSGAHLYIYEGGTWVDYYGTLDSLSSAASVQKVVVNDESYQELQG